MYDGELFERMPDGALLLDASGALLRANGVARAILAAADGLLLRGGRLVAPSEKETRRLHRLTDAARCPAEDAVADGYVSLPRPSGRPPFHALVAALRGADAWAGDDARVAVFVRDPGRPAMPRGEAGTRGLTPMERRLAFPLLAGASLEEAQRLSGVCPRTLRSSVAEIFEIEDRARRDELIRGLLSQPPELP